MLINSNISTDLYSQLNIQHSDITVIHLKGDFRHCSIFNIYNNCDDNSTTNSLHAYLTANPTLALPSPTDHMLWLSDFNRHHLLWEEDRNHRLYNLAALIDPLMDLISNYDMLLTLPLGIPTYETTNGNWTRPDSTWQLNNPINPIILCNVNPSLCPPCTDHLPIITELNLEIS